MLKKVLVYILSISMTLTACGGVPINKDSNAVKESTESVESSYEDTESAASDDTDSLDVLGDVKVDNNLFNVEITVPKDFVGEITQEELDAPGTEKNYNTATLNDDGSVTYKMSKSQHQDMLKSIADSIDEGLNGMIGSEDYPNITDVKADSDYTSFTVTTKNEETSLTETLSVLVLYMYGGMYAVFNGTTVDNVHVEFINEGSGQIIDTFDSKNMSETEESE